AKDRQRPKGRNPASRRRARAGRETCSAERAGASGNPRNYRSTCYSQQTWRATDNFVHRLSTGYAKDLEPMTGQFFLQFPAVDREFPTTLNRLSRSGGRAKA